ncbi:MAG: ABC transporter substrate-binding protein [Allgaiera sp.]|jgi:sn-glycerol 3-phosphate transport system substrate-binding protein|nr:ABC transporter substrate-binding protein [Allgaiera sp.]
MIHWKTLAAAGALAFGLGQTAQSAQAATNIELYFPVPVQGKLANKMKSLMETFNKAHPDIDATAVYTGSYDETNLKTRAAIRAGNPPAAVIMSANFILEYQINNEIQPLDPMIKADGMTDKSFMDQYWQALHGNAEFAGHVWAVPFQNSTPLLYLNVKAFKEAGLNPDNPPQTWAEWAAAAKKLTKRDGNSVSQYGLMMPGNYDYLGWIVSALDMSNGGQYYNTDFGGEVYYDQPSMLGAVRFMHNLVFKDKVMPQGVTNAKDVSTSFFAGKAAMVVLSTGALSFVRDNMKDNFRVAFLPGHLRHAVAIGGASLRMPKGLSPAKQEAAWTLIKWLTSPKVAGEWSRFTGYFAPNKGAYDLPEMKDFMAQHPNAQVALKQLAYAHPWFATYNTVAVRKALEDQVQAVLSGNETPEKAVKAAQAKADQLMAPYVAQTALKLPD